LARVGAVALKNSVYVLPKGDSGAEDFQWVRREIVAGGGDATIVDAQLVDGLSDQEVEALFRGARDEDYAELVAQARDAGKKHRKLKAETRTAFESEVARLERRLEEIASIDFFDAAGRGPALAAVSALRERLTDGEHPAQERPLPTQQYQARTWVTRAGVHVDRIASAWLIRRFIDPAATIKLVPAKGYEPLAGELRFDMFEAEFSHVGEHCTFEVLCDRFALQEPGLRALAEVVHDIDLKDGKYARPEAPGVAAQIAGIALLERDDHARLRDGAKMCEQLLAYYARKQENRP